MAAARALIDEYDEMERKIAEADPKLEEDIAASWQQGVERANRQLDVGYRTAMRNVKKVLGLQGLSAVEEKEEQGGGEDEGAMNQKPLNYELQRTLQYAERGVKRMVKGLPRDEDVDI